MKKISTKNSLHFFCSSATLFSNKGETEFKSHEAYKKLNKQTTMLKSYGYQSIYECKQFI